VCLLLSRDLLLHSLIVSVYLVWARVSFAWHGSSIASPCLSIAHSNASLSFFMGVCLLLSLVLRLHRLIFLLLIPAFRFFVGVCILLGLVVLLLSLIFLLLILMCRLLLLLFRCIC